MNASRRISQRIFCDKFKKKKNCFLHQAGYAALNRKVVSSISRRDEDWNVLKEIFIKAFHKYPLYKYLVEDENKRSKFLQRYLDSIYDVTVRKNDSFLLCFLNKQAASMNSNIVVGGCLLHQPCFEGRSWKSCSDEEYTEAYERNKLKEIDAATHAKLIRYESWESSEILEKIQSTGIPIWNAIFFAVTPQFACNGLGADGFDMGVPELYQWQKDFEANASVQYNTAKSLKTDLLSRLDHHRHHIKDENSGHSSIYEETTEYSTDSPFLILGITHCPRAVQFHLKNGMEFITKVPYYDFSDESNSKIIPFEVYVLVFDPFNTGSTRYIKESFGV